MLPRPPRLIYRLVAAALAVLALCVARAESVSRTFDIPGGPAESTLRRFGEQAGGQFIFSQQKVTGVKTSGVKGRFDPFTALSKMLAGTPLQPVQDPQTGALTVGRRDDASTDVETPPRAQCSENGTTPRGV